jgi:TRAP-type C4-dicarboxylate transport system permease small subunit
VYYVELSVLSICLIGMIFLATAQIALRNFLNTGIEGAEVILRHLVLWLGLLGASLATREGRHINIDIASRLLPRRLGYLNYMIINCIATAVTAVLAVSACRFLKMELQAGEQLQFGFSDTFFSFSIPLWCLQIVIPAGFTIISFRFMGRCITAARLTLKGGGDV